MDAGYLIGILGGITGIVGVVWGITRQKKTDVKEEGQQDARIEADIKYIMKRSDDTLLEVRDIRKCYDAQNERLTRCEESTKSAHHRIDGLERKYEMGG